MPDFTGDAKKFLQNYIKKIKEAKTSSDINQNEVAEYLHKNKSAGHSLFISAKHIRLQ